MEKQNCFFCYHFPVCHIHSLLARQKEMWNTPEKLIEHYIQTAKSCDYWGEDTVVASEIAGHELLRRVIELLEQGKTVMLQNNGNGSSYHLTGMFDKPEEAIARRNGQHAVILKAVP